MASAENRYTVQKVNLQSGTGKASGAAPAVAARAAGCTQPLLRARSASWLILGPPAMKGRVGMQRKLSKIRSRLDRERLLQLKIHFACFRELYKIDTLCCTAPNAKTNFAVPSPPSTHPPTHPPPSLKMFDQFPGFCKFR